ncbi:MAG: TRAP transporter substrate-binding protein [Pseudomonadota bacterium]
MRKMQRFGFFLVLVLAMMWIPYTSIAAEKVKLELSSTLAPGSCIELAADKFKDIVQKKSNKRIVVVRFPSGELYDPKAEIEAVATGNLAMATLHNSYVGGRSPALEFISSFGAQGCWQDHDHYFRFTDLPRVREIAAKEFETKINAKFLAMLPYGDSVIGNSRRPIHTVADYKGLKIRTAGSAQATMYRALGIVPTELSASEVYMALQRGTIDGACSGPSRFFLSKWYEVTPYITQDFSLPYLSFWLGISLRFWDKLSKEDQQLIQDAAQEVEAWARSYVVEETAGFNEKIKGKIKEFYFLPKDEVAKIGSIAGPVMHELIVKRAGKEMGEELWSLVNQTKK